MNRKHQKLRVRLQHRHDFGDVVDARHENQNTRAFDADRADQRYGRFVLGQAEFGGDFWNM